MIRGAAGLALVPALLFSGGETAWAGTGTSTLTARARVNSNCTIAAQAVRFGSYDPIGSNRSAALNATGSITVTCTRGISPTIGLGPGSNAAGDTRRMSSGADFLVYELYKPPGNAPGVPCTFPGAAVWRNAGADVLLTTTTTDKNPRTYNVCGSVPAGQNPAVGTYADTVVATVIF